MRPREHEVKGSCENSVERPMEIIETHSVRLEDRDMAVLGGSTALILEGSGRP